MTKNVLRIMGLMAVVFYLVGCGQSGRLYLPQNNPKSDLLSDTSSVEPIKY